MERQVQSLDLEKRLVEDQADKLDSHIDKMKIELGQHEAGLATLRQHVKETEQLQNEARASLNLNEVEITELRSANETLQKAATDREAERTQQALELEEARADSAYKGKELLGSQGRGKLSAQLVQTFSNNETPAPG
ncbi:hypothetical protein ACFE04_022976 [Oxalis oulophora]